MHRSVIIIGMQFHGLLQSLQLDPRKSTATFLSKLVATLPVPGNKR